MLLQKVYNGDTLGEFEEFLKGLCEGLRVELTDLSLVENGWIKIMLSGEDEKVAVRFLEREVGLAPVSIESVKHFSVLYGRVVFSGQSRAEVFVDVGVLSPKPVYAAVPLQRLQGQLIDGRKFALGRIVELFGLVDGFPLEVRIIKIGIDEFRVELTERQLKLYNSWVGSRVDRLVVLGALCESVEEAVWKGRLNRDVLGVESLSVLEHVVTCKLGTDAVGLVSRLGRWLPRAGLVVFSPRRILELVGDRW